MQYDILAKEYAKTNETILKKYVTIETIFHTLGAITDKNILDLGCGSGYFCRLYKTLGAKRVVGLDISENQIELAEKEELQNPLGIEYRVKDVTEHLEFESEFDVITAIFLLNYIENKDNIAKIAQNISRSLRDGGGHFCSNNSKSRHQTPIPQKIRQNHQHQQKSSRRQ